jgi:hypothetical protein
MGKCIYCGEPAGFLKKVHKECAAKHEEGKNKMVALVRDTILDKGEYASLYNKLSGIAEESFIPADNIKRFLIRGWGSAVEGILGDGILDEDEEQRLVGFYNHFGITQNELENDGSFLKVVKAAVLRDILMGEIPDRVKYSGFLPFNFQKNEKLIWLFKQVPYYERSTRTHYEGGHHGISVRVAKGFYYRVGSFKGYPVSTDQTVHVDTGLLAITNKHIYFGGDQKSFRIKFEKIMAMTPYEDGISIQRDAATAKPQLFITGDGWFTYNLIFNLQTQESK